jgi:hypothetical protein
MPLVFVYRLRLFLVEIDELRILKMRREVWLWYFYTVVSFVVGLGIYLFMGSACGICSWLV